MQTTRLWIALLATPLAAISLHAESLPIATSAITSTELVRRTQELFDAVASGNRTPWDRYFAADCLYFDEKGRKMDKAGLLADLSPLPAGFSGTIRIVNPDARIFADVAILSYDMDEIEMVFGQQQLARYHATDTWLLHQGKWQIEAEQVLRYYEDPAPGIAQPEKYPDYVGAYQLVAGRTLRVAVESGSVVLLRSGNRHTKLVVESGDVFFAPGDEGRYVFRRVAGGKVDALIQRRNNEDIVWAKL